VRGFLTRGQPAAVEAASAMLAAGMPHALLLAGPTGVGKTTLALDLAAGLLCVNPDRSVRPCRECRGCRAVEHGNHPDLHRLGPVGAGAVIPIGGGDQRGVRDLVRELSLLPVEGGARVAVVEAAERMTEDAQSALLKTLEEPPTGTVLILCAEDDERLLPTIRSRCVRIRLGPVAGRAIEQLLVERGVADAPTAARLGRLAGGRPGTAILLADAPDAVRLHGEISRSLLDLIGRPRADRLVGIRDLAARAAEMLRATRPQLAAPKVTGRGRGRGVAVPPDAELHEARETSADGGPGADPVADAVAAEGPVGKVPAAERRAAALALVGVWRSVVRDLALVRLEAPGRTHDPALLDDLEGAAGALAPEDAGAHLRRLELAGERLEGNVSPELVLDDLALDWRRSGS
jgi:DNA polymerase III delta' subunit